MSATPDSRGRDHSELELVNLYVLEALPSSEIPALETHISACAQCQRELVSLRPVIDAFVSWPTDVLRPPSSLRGRLAQRIAAATDKKPGLATPPRWTEPEWEEVAPGISCKLLATDTQNHRISMLVHLAPGTDYPPHCHAGVEELHLLDGELLIDGRKLYPGDYNQAEPGTVDSCVRSETGCTCVLVTSTRDRLR